MRWDNTIVCIHAFVHGFEKGKEDWIQWGGIGVWGLSVSSGICCQMHTPKQWGTKNK